jgi:hypothetical protein
MFLLAAVSPGEGFARPMRVSWPGEFVKRHAPAIVSECLAGVQDRVSVLRVDICASAQQEEKRNGSQSHTLLMVEAEIRSEGQWPASGSKAHSEQGFPGYDGNEG